ncbi:ABC transporter permease [Bosea sp. (in: a-proteobacteria)]|uniref:ABC transporter permease n=1 Tax=Bosea sp. (in: a-proteobacteria) TaxID=1871050 RepID=UPI0026318DEB|nr:ABC transporter permease [Bosea sp. (in: a-proteobacteria)]MCO5089943.1 ABC transporter permease [Bosea sp. (in: a-proteobacteria)]
MPSELASGPARRIGGLSRDYLGMWLVLAFLSLFFLYPLARILVLSLSEEGQFSLGVYARLLGEPTTREVLLQTIRTSLTVSLICALVAYPAATRLASLSGWQATLCNLAILFPFLTSSLVRTFVFIVLLGRRGIVNQALEFLGVPGGPYKLLFNQVGVVIGMSYVLLPYMLLSLVGSMKRIDPALLRAARSLGASPFTVFRTVYLPLSLPGLAAGFVITTILGFGYFVTPALMGGPGDMMIAQLVEQQISVTYNLAAAAALAVIMIVVVAAAYAVASRWLGLSRLMRPDS